MLTSRKMHILRCMGSKNLCDIPKDTFRISHKSLNPHSAKYGIFYFYFCAWFTISLNSDVISLSETVPSPANPDGRCFNRSAQNFYFRDVSLFHDTRMGNRRTLIKGMCYNFCNMQQIYVNGLVQYCMKIVYSAKCATIFSSQKKYRILL